MKDRYWGTVRCLCDKFRVKGHKCHLTCTPMFPAVLLTAAKTWKQPEHLSTDGWIKKTWCVYTVECYSAMKKNEIVPFAATWMDLEMIMQSKVSQKDKYYTVSLVRPKIYTNELTYETERLTDTENRLPVTKGSGRGLGWELVTSGCKLFYIEWMKKQGPALQPRNYSTHQFIINHNGKNMKRNTCVCTGGCITEVLCCTPATNPTL